MRGINARLPRLFLLLNKVKYGKHLKLYGWPLIFRFSEATIRIGNDVTLNSGILSNMLGLYQRTIIVAKGDARIDIGDRVGISGATIYAWSGITIGDNSKIGANVKIVDTDFHPVDPQARLSGRDGEAETKPVKIGKNVFIGMNAIILKGSEIGDNCVVGAGAVAGGIYESGSVIAGNPARVIGRNRNKNK